MGDGGGVRVSVGVNVKVGVALAVCVGMGVSVGRAVWVGVAAWLVIEGKICCSAVPAAALQADNAKHSTIKQASFFILFSYLTRAKQGGKSYRPRP